MVTSFVFGRVQLKWGQGVCECGGAVTQRHHEGRLSGPTNTAQRLTNMSHILQDLKASIFLRHPRNLTENLMPVKYKDAV